MDITFFSNNEHSIPLTPSQSALIECECAFFVVLISMILLAAIYVSVAYLYKLSIKKPLILAYYILVILTALAKIATYSWVIIRPLTKLD